MIYLKHLRGYTTQIKTDLGTSFLVAGNKIIAAQDRDGVYWRTQDRLPKRQADALKRWTEDQPTKWAEQSKLVALAEVSGVTIQ